MDGFDILDNVNIFDLLPAKHTADTTKVKPVVKRRRSRQCVRKKVYKTDKLVELQTHGLIASTVIDSVRTIIATIQRAGFCMEACHTKRMVTLLLYVLYGKKQLVKFPVNPDDLSSTEAFIYKNALTAFQNPVCHAKIMSFLSDEKISKRLLNFFIVHYILLYNPLTYTLDRRSYPYIVSNYNTEIPGNDIHSLAGTELINLHQEYKKSKFCRAQKNMHSPYARSVSVTDKLFTWNSKQFSLCEVNFAIWLDRVGGIDIFYKFYPDIKAKKLVHDRKGRKRRTEQTNAMKKRKVILKETNGLNYQFVLQKGAKMR